MIQAAILDAPFDFCELRPIEARAGDTVHALAAAMPRHLPFIACFNGEVLLRAEWGRALEHGDRLIFVIGPAGSGGVKDVLRFTLTIGLMLTSGYFLGAGGLGLTGWKFGAAMLAANAAAGLLVNAILPIEAPQMQTVGSPEAASPTYSLSGAGNQARLGSPRVKHFGYHDLTPDYDAAWYTEYRGNDMYLHQIFNLGIGHYHQHQWLLEDTPVWTEEDGFTDSFSDIEFEYLEPGEEVTLVAPNVVTSIEVTGQPLLGPNEEGHTPVGPFVANPAGTIANQLAFDIVFGGGLGRVTDSGGIAPVSVTVKFEAQQIDDAGEPIGEWIELASPVYNYKTRTPQRISEKFPVAAGRWRGHVTRVSDAANEDRTFDAVAWEGMRAYLANGGSGSLDCTRLAMIWRASDQLSELSSRRFRTVQTSLLPEYLGQDEETGEHLWGSLAPARDLFPICRYILTDPDLRPGMPDIGMAEDMFAPLHPTWVARGDTFDGVIDRAMSVGEALTMVLRVGRAQPVWVGSEIGVTRDEEKALARQLFTPRNIVRGSFEYQPLLPTPVSPNAIIVEYRDERFWTKREVFCSVRGVDPATARAKRIFVQGIIDRARAWKFGITLDAAETWRRELASWDVEHEGELLIRGDPVDVAHPLPNWGMSLAIRAAAIEAREIVLAADARWSAAETNFLWLRRPDGTGWGPVIAAKGESARIAILDEVDLAAVTAQQGDPADFLSEEDGTREPAVAIIGSGSDMVARALLIATDTAGSNRIRLETVIDDPRVYSAEADFEIPAEVALPANPRPTDRPQLGPMSIAVSGTRYAPILSASVAPARGATTYIWALSYDDIAYEPLGQGATMYGWSGPVLPSTVYLRCIAIGPGGRDMRKSLRDLTISEAAPGEVTGIGFDVYFDSAIAKFSLPKVNGQTEEGLRGVLLAWAFASGFDPEDEDEREGLARVEPAASRIEFPLDEDQVYVRAAAYNVFGETALNWSSEQLVERLKIGAGALSEQIQLALAGAESISGGVVFKLDDEGRLGGLILVGGDGEPIAAGIQADIFQISHPGIGDGEPFPLFTADEEGVKINNLVAATVTAQDIYAALVSVGRLEGLIFSSPLGEGETLDDAALVVDTQAPYILQRKVVS